MILAPWSMDVGYFYDIIFLSCFEIYQGLKSTVSRGLPKNQTKRRAGAVERILMGAAAICFKQIGHQPSFWE